MPYCYYCKAVHDYYNDAYCIGIYCIKCRTNYEVHPFTNVLTCFVHPSYEEVAHA